MPPKAAKKTRSKTKADSPVKSKAKTLAASPVKTKTKTKVASPVKRRPGRQPKNDNQSLVDNEDGFPVLSSFEGFESEDLGESGYSNGATSLVDASSVVVECAPATSVPTTQQEQQPNLVELLRVEKAKNAALQVKCSSIAKDFHDFKESTLARTQHLEAEMSKLVRQKPKQTREERGSPSSDEESASGQETVPLPPTRIRYSSQSSRSKSSKSDSDNEESSLSEADYVAPVDKSECHFNPEWDFIAECEQKAKDEVTRLMGSTEAWKKKNPGRRLPPTFIKQNQVYTMSSFISEVMTNGFEASYLKGKKLTNQIAKQGRNLKTAMEPHDVQQVTDIVYRAWKRLPLLPRKKDSQKEVRRCIRSTLTTFLSNKRVGNLAK
ncbi:uncharacterized protein LOC124328853 [Daphnia pulicaria]|uniref:uncharacterized protein LOC124328853 n=1 Tax=Daphnia pulicaria TaxID=35523 RepID=UPI001EEBA2DF|nr:uncharacterized protein LOC124328853 [Daphnia pulicaria]